MMQEKPNLEKDQTHMLEVIQFTNIIKLKEVFQSSRKNYKVENHNTTINHITVEDITTNHTVDMIITEEVVIIEVEEVVSEGAIEDTVVTEVVVIEEEEDIQEVTEVAIEEEVDLVVTEVETEVEEDTDSNDDKIKSNFYSINNNELIVLLFVCLLV